MRIRLFVENFCNFSFYNRPMIIDPLAQIVSLTHILCLTKSEPDQLDAVVTSTRRFRRYSVWTTGDRALETVGTRSLFAHKRSVVLKCLKPTLGIGISTLVRTTMHIRLLDRLKAAIGGSLKT